MATYKKHGKNKKTREEKIVQKSTIAKFFGKLDIGAAMFEDWVSRNSKPILSIIGVIIVAVLGYLAYSNFVVKPRQEQAVNEMSQSMIYFNQAMQVDAGPDQDTLLMKTLNGAGSYGLLDIIDNYSGTDAANIAEYTAGMSYLKLRQYQKAIDHLQNFSSKDEFYPAIAKGAIGDAYSELKQPEQALKYYEDAANMRDNNFTTPKYLMKAAVMAIDLGQKDKAKTYLNKIEDKYPESSEASKVSALLGMAENSTK